MESRTLSHISILYILLYCINNSSTLSSTKIYTVESDKVCSLVKKRHIHLGQNNTSAAVVKETRYFDTWFGDKSFTCKFLVEAEFGTQDGVVAVIQNLSLRKDSLGNCIDYIQFRPKNEKWSEKVCGKLSAWHMTFLDPVLAYIDRDGHMDVLIYVADKRLELDSKIDIDISFTSYKECGGKASHYKNCSSSDYKDVLPKQICIWEGYFNDDIINCPFHNCLDEGGCPKFLDEIEVSHGPSPAVVTGAGIATLLLVFGSFLACIWLLRKLQLLCWSFPGLNGQQTAVVEFSGHSSRDVSASAPSCDITLQQVPPDKDEPPAYDVLFPPERQT